MKKLFLSVGMVILILFSGCNVDATLNDDIEVESESQVDVSAFDNLGEPIISTYEYEYDYLDARISEPLKVEECVIWEQDGIEIKTTDFVYYESGDKSGYYLEFLINNSTDTEYIVDCVDYVVNGMYINDGMALWDLPIGTGERNAHIDMDCELIENSGIEIISDVEFRLRFSDADSNIIFDTGLLHVKTNISDEYQHVQDGSGMVLMENDDIKLVSKGIYYKYNEEHDQYETNLHLCVYNKSDEPLTVYIDNIYLDEMLHSYTIKLRTHPDKYSVSAFPLYTDDENYINVGFQSIAMKKVHVIGNADNELYSQDIVIKYEE